MRLVLVDNLLYEDGFRVHHRDLQPHLGLMSLVAVARQHGHEALIYDPKWDLLRGETRLDRTYYDSTAERILAHAPDIVGFTALGCNFHAVVRIAAAVRQMRRDVPLLLGGPHATILDHEILAAFPQFDVIARHEAEQTLVPLLEGLGSMRLSGVPGISYRCLNGVQRNEGLAAIRDLDELPFPAYDSYPLGEYGLSTVRVEAGRGCPFGCTFCSTASFFGRNYRLKSATRIVGEMDFGLVPFCETRV